MAIHLQGFHTLNELPKTDFDAAASAVYFYIILMRKRDAFPMGSITQIHIVAVVERAALGYALGIYLATGTCTSFTN